MRRLAFLFLFLSTSAYADPLHDFAVWIEQAEEARLEDLNELAENCSVDTARQISFETLAIYSADYNGECVTVSGLGQGRHLYQSPDYIYLRDRWASEIHQALIFGANPFVIGIGYNELPAPDAGPWLHEMRVTGIAEDCNAFSDQLARRKAIEQLDVGSTIIFHATGYCHSSGGAVVHPVAIDYGEQRRFERLMGDEARARFGSLAFVSPGTPLHNELSEAAARFYSALKAGDRAALLRPEGSLEDRERSYFDDPQSPFRYVASASDIPATALFRSTRDDQYDFDADSGSRSLEGYFCFCRDGNCRQQWPISWRDMGMEVYHPYVCVHRQRIALADGEQRIVEGPAGRVHSIEASPFHEPSLLDP